MRSWINSILLIVSFSQYRKSTNLNKAQQTSLNRTHSEPQQITFWSSTEHSEPHQNTLNLNRTHNMNLSNRNLNNRNLYLNCIVLYLNCWNLQSVVYDARKVRNSYLKNKQIWTESETEREASHKGQKEEGRFDVIVWNRFSVSRWRLFVVWWWWCSVSGSHGQAQCRGGPCDLLVHVVCSLTGRDVTTWWDVVRTSERSLKELRARTEQRERSLSAYTTHTHCKARM